MTAPVPTLTPDAAPDRRRSRLPSRRAVLLGLGVAGLGVTGGAAWALDRFVIEHVEVDSVSAYEDQKGAAGATIDTSQATVTATSWTAGENSITVSRRTTGSGEETVTFFVADVVLTDATLLRSAFAQDQFGENITEDTSDIAGEVGAILAVNGDYYGFRDTGIVIRNGVAYRDEPAREGLAIYRDGRLAVYDETATDAETLLADGVWHTLSFGPAIVECGAAVAGIDEVEIDTNVGNHSIQGRQPRTAIGAVETNHLVIVVVDGRDPGYSAGVTLPELAQLMIDLSAQTAYNLDGGGSSTLWFDGDVVNRPSNGGERGVSDILYVAG